MRRPRAVPMIIALNIFVFILWGALDQDFMAEHFLVSWDALVEGRIWTLITSVFSHNMFLHLFINMYAFYGFGSVVEATLGFRRFIRFYLMAGVVASLIHCVASTLLLGQPEMAALGASGAVVGVVVLFSLLYPREKILIFALLPVPALWGAVLAVGLDLWGLMSQARGHGLPIGHGAHLGGALAGASYYLFSLRRRSHKGV